MELSTFVESNHIQLGGTLSDTSDDSESRRREATESMMQSVHFRFIRKRKNPILVKEPVKYSNYPSEHRQQL